MYQDWSSCPSYLCIHGIEQTRVCPNCNPVQISMKAIERLTDIWEIITSIIKRLQYIVISKDPFSESINLTTVSSCSRIVGSNCFKAVFVKEPPNIRLNLSWYSRFLSINVQCGRKKTLKKACSHPPWHQEVEINCCKCCLSRLWIFYHVYPALH